MDEQKHILQREATQAAVNDCLVVDSIDAMDYSERERQTSKRSSPSPATSIPAGFTTTESRNNLTKLSPSPYKDATVSRTEDVTARTPLT